MGPDAYISSKLRSIHYIFSILILPMTAGTLYETIGYFKFGKGVCQGYILSPCLFNLHAEYIMRKAGLDEAQGGIKISRRNISITSDMQMTSPLWQKVKNLRAS